MINPVKIAILSCNHGHARFYYSLCQSEYYDLLGASIACGYRNNVGLEMWPDIPVYDSDDELLEAHPDIEAVVIASENSRHLEQVRWAVEHKLHILSMKIPTFDKREYFEMIELIKNYDHAFMIELEMRHHAEVMRIKDLIESGEIGEVLSITALNYSHNPVWWRAWQGNPEASYGKRIPLYPGADRFRGGALADHPHVFDMIRYVLNDDFDELYAEVGPNLRDTEIEEIIPIVGKTKKGVSVSIDPSYAEVERKTVRMIGWRDWRSAPKSVEVTMTVHGTKGSIIADVYGTWFFQNGGPHNLYVGNQTTRQIDLSNLAMQFYREIRKDQPSSVSLEYHYNTIAAINAAYESVFSGEPKKVENYSDIIH